VENTRAKFIFEHLSQMGGFMGLLLVVAIAGLLPVAVFFV